jgi:hypothetical protein
MPRPQMSLRIGKDFCLGSRDLRDDIQRATTRKVRFIANELRPTSARPHNVRIRGGGRGVPFGVDLDRRRGKGGRAIAKCVDAGPGPIAAIHSLIVLRPKKGYVRRDGNS